MAIVNCPSCGQSVNTSLGACLKCGAKVMPSGILASKPSDPKQLETIIKYIVSLVIIISLLGGYYLLFGQNASPEEVLQEEQKLAENKRKGFHCLSSWDGSHRNVVAVIKKNLKDPDSFDHVETRLSPVNGSGNHSLVMTYRAKNSFGGLTLGTVTAIIDNSDCTASVISTK